MSTKISLFYNSKVHAYQECYDEDGVFVQFNDDDFSVTRRMKLDEFVGMAASVSYDSLVRQAAVTDERIRAFVESRVSARSQTHCPFSQYHENNIYGEISDPSSLQVERGVAFFTGKRDALRALAEKVGSQRQKHLFGLEQLL